MYTRLNGNGFSSIIPWFTGENDLGFVRCHYLEVVRAVVLPMSCLHKYRFKHCAIASSGGLK